MLETNLIELRHQLQRAPRAFVEQLLHHAIAKGYDRHEPYVEAFRLVREAFVGYTALSEVTV